MNKMDEKILVVGRNHLFENGNLTFQGLLTYYPTVRHIMEKFEDYFEVRRGDAEENFFWKQPIPYVIIKRGKEVFLYKRLKAGGEARLHDQLSIGIGGHMNELYKNNWTLNLTSNLQKELHEELIIELSAEPTLEIHGLINDDSNDVGKVHIGIVATYEMPLGSDVSVRETDKLEGHWVRIHDLKKSPLFESLETWSKMALEIL